MVEVEVGDEHGIQAAGHGGIRGGRRAGERADARAQHGVGQQAPPAELEQDGRVPDPREAVAQANSRAADAAA